MRYEIVFSEPAIEHLESLRANVRAAVRDAIETHLRHEPMKLSRSRMKRLKEVSKPRFRLRVDEVRVFYDVSAGQVEVLAILMKSQAHTWLQKQGAFP